MPLCTKHHTLVHEGGFRIEQDFQNRWYFLRPDGVAVPVCGYSSADMLDDDGPEASDRFDAYKLPPAGGMLSAAEKTVSEPVVPVYWH